MKTALWVTLSLSILTLAGCVEETPALTEDDCKVLGLILDPAVETVDNETGETTLAPGCVEDIPSVTVHMEGLPATAEAYLPIELTWVMHTTLDKDHSHTNGIRFSKESNPSYLGKLDGYGDAIPGFEEHRDFVEGDSSTVSWYAPTPGTYYVRAYAVSAWGNYWAPEHTIEITDVQPTGVREEVVLFGGGLQEISSATPADLQVNLGDEVYWTTDDPGVTWTISRTRGPDDAERFTRTANDVGMVFLVPGAYTYSATTEAGSITGLTISVVTP